MDSVNDCATLKADDTPGSKAFKECTLARMLISLVSSLDMRWIEDEEITKELPPLPIGSPTSS